jgi:predicted CDP-diglyceride synthetase/phosphatidate cytidylyltransferase
VVTLSRVMPVLSPVFSRCKSNSFHSFPLMCKELGSPETWDVFFDANALKQSATVVLRGMTSQLAAKELLQPAITNGTASVTVIEDKLQIKTVSLFIMTASFIVTTLLSVAMILLLRKSVVPRGYESITTHATVLAHQS